MSLSAQINQTRNRMMKIGQAKGGTNENDVLILSVLENGFITVDFETGEIFSYRIPGQKGKKVNLKGAVSNGYKVHYLSYKGVKKLVKAHRIVWMAKNGRIPEGLVIDHINRNKVDNRLCNLRAVTQKENYMNQENPTGENHITAKLSDKEVMEIRNLYETTNNGVRRIAKLYNVGKSQVHNIVTGKSRKMEG